MGAYVLLNLANELGKNIRCEALLSILLLFPSEFIKSNANFNIGRKNANHFLY